MNLAVKIPVRNGHDGYVSSVVFSPDGGLVATASQDGSVRLWPLDGGEPSRVLGLRVLPLQAAFRPDGKVIAVAGGRSVFVFNVASGELQSERKGHAGTVKVLAYSPDGKHLASAGNDGAVILRDAASNEIVGQRYLEIGKLTALTWRADSSGLVVGGEKHIAVCQRDELLVKQEKRPQGEPLSLAGPGSKIKGLSYSPDGRTLASWDRCPTWLCWDLSGGAGQAKALAKPRTNFGDADVVSWSPDSTHLAVSRPDRFGVLSIGDLRTWEKREIVMRGLAFHHLAYTPRGRLFLAGSAKSIDERWTRLELREADREQIVYAKQIDMPDRRVAITHSAFSRDGQRVYAAFPSHGLYRWTPASDEFVRLFTQSSIITALEVSADERLALTVGGNTALLWSLPEGKKLMGFKHPLACSGAALLPGGRLITACCDGLVRVWDAGGSEILALDLGMGKICALAVSPDHMTFAAGVHKKNRIVLMDVPD